MKVDSFRFLPRTFRPLYEGRGPFPGMRTLYGRHLESAWRNRESPFSPRPVFI
jgi:hypothetical protein